MLTRRYKIPIVLSFLLLGWAFRCNAYAALTHEAMIDATWDKIIVPLLQQKFPNAGSKEIAAAKAYAYGGAVISDMRDYPFGDYKFTNLIHYVRPGDFVTTIMSDAINIYEYAFALGILSHYYADCYGHSMCINMSVPLVYPNLKRKFGDTVSFANDHLSHSRVELSFDVFQTAMGNFVSTKLHRQTGFKVAQRLLEEAFLETYGIEVKSLFRNLGKSISKFRKSLVWTYPEAIAAGWIFREDEIKDEIAYEEDNNLAYYLPGRPDKKENRSSQKKPIILARIIAIYIRNGPRFGQFKALKFITPDSKEIKLFGQSFDTAAYYYGVNMKMMPNETKAVANIDYDTGKPTAPGEYSLADDSYEMLLFKIQANGIRNVNEALKKSILSFYDQPGASIIFDRDPKKAEEIKKALGQLRL